MKILNPKTICITGPECSGKTSLSEFICQSSGGILVNEYAREYLLQIGRNYGEDDLLYIAKKQRDQIMDALKRSEGEPVVIDTDLTVIHIWSDEKFGRVDAQIRKWNAEENYSHYLLCRPDLPWKYDILRENEHDRPRLFDRYFIELKKAGKNFKVIEGDWRTRTKTAMDFCESEIG